MKFTNKYNLPDTVFEAITKDNYDLTNMDHNIISATSLISSPKIRLLKMRHAEEIEEDVSDNVWRLLGSSVHAVLENVDNKNRLIEERISMNIDGKIISGKTDLYEQGGVISDYKVTSAWTIVFNSDGKKEWEEQLNIYAFLYRKMGLEVNRLQVVAILRDWSKTKAKQDQNYPQIPVVVINIPLWEMEKQEKFITDRIKIHEAFENVDDDLIPECSPADRFNTGNKWAVYKGTNKRALRVFDSEEEALLFCEAIRDGCPETKIEKRVGEDKKCLDYCPVNKFCHYYQLKYGDKNED